MDHSCAYNHCLHPGSMVGDNEAVIDKGKYYHWDCLQVRNDIRELRDLYINGIDRNAKIPVLSKVLNDLVFKYDQPIEYIKFGIDYYIRHKITIKSPFTLLYLRKNKMMQREYSRHKDVSI